MDDIELCFSKRKKYIDFGCNSTLLRTRRESNWQTQQLSRVDSVSRHTVVDVHDVLLDDTGPANVHDEERRSDNASVQSQSHEVIVEQSSAQCLRDQPVLANDLVFFGEDSGTFAALDARSGEPLACGGRPGPEGVADDNGS